MKKYIPTQQKSWWARYGKPIVFAEIVFFGFCYVEYRRLNQSAVTRYEYSKKHPQVLNMYYQLGERMGGLKTREEDQERWKYYERALPDKET